jgi:hypothetical protein
MFPVRNSLAVCEYKHPVCIEANPKIADLKTSSIDRLKSFWNYLCRQINQMVTLSLSRSSLIKLHRPLSITTVPVNKAEGLLIGTTCQRATGLQFEFMECYNPI